MCSQRTREATIVAGAGDAYVLRSGEGRSIDLGVFSMTVKANADETNGVFSLLEAEEPPGFGPPVHVHHDAAEAFYVLEGEYVMFLDDREVACPAGSFIFIPQGVPHGLRVGAVPTRKLNFYPAAMTAYFSDLPAALARSGVTDEDLTEIAEAHHMHIVGPLRSGTSRATPGTVDYD